MYEFLLIAGVVLWMTMAFVYIRTGVASAFHPATFYMLFHGFIFVVRPVFAWIGDYRYVYRVYSFNPPMDAKITALLVANLGFVCFMATVLRVGRTVLVLEPTTGSRPDLQRSVRGQLLITAALLAPLGIYSLRYVLSGDADQTVGMRFDGATGLTVSTTGNGYLFTAGDIVGALAVLIAWQYRFRPLALVPFFLYVLTRASFGGMRWAFLLTSAALALFWLYDRRRTWPSATIVMGFMLLLAGFAVIGQQRDIVRAYLTGGEVRHDMFQQSVLEGMDYANMEYLEYQTWIIPDKTGTWGYFADNLQAFTEPVPRVLWSGKPLGAPVKMYDIFDYGTPIGMTNSLPGEGWDQFGYAGVVIWCVLWGWLFGKFYNWFANARQTGFSVGLYLLLLPLSVQFFRDGSLLTVLKFPMWTIIVLLTWLLMARLFPGRRRKAPARSRRLRLQPSYTIIDERADI